MSLTTLSAAPAPEAIISTTDLRVRLFLPDAQTGFYRGTRFDWSGVIGALEYGGHDFFPQWFQRTDPKVHDFVYDGADIVASPCTAVTGPSEEFVSPGGALGFSDAKPGGTFVKIGVDVLRKPDDKNYDAYRLYQVVDGGKWSVGKNAQSVDFTQSLSDGATGYGYEYRKTVSVSNDRMTLEHRLRNTGGKAIATSVYNHNFLYLDRRAPGPEVSITVPFRIKPNPAPDPALARVEGGRISFSKTLAGEERVYMAISGFGTDPKDYDIRIEDRKAGVGVRITGDRPLSRAALWSIRAPLSFEPFIEMMVEPGAEFSWRINYDFYKLR